MQDSTKKLSLIEQLKAANSVTTENPLSLKLPEPTTDSGDVMQKAIASDRARGCSLESLCEKYDMSIGALESLESQPMFQDLVIRMQGVLEIPVEQRVENAATVAFEKRYKLLTTSKDERIIEKISEGFLDRKMGKAPAKLEVVSRNFNVTGDIGQMNKDIELVNNQIASIEAEQRKLREDSVDIT